ncbi:MAG: pilus assembly protein PilP [Myxococcaceae bacterium]
MIPKFSVRVVLVCLGCFAAACGSDAPTKAIGQAGAKKAAPKAAAAATSQASAPIAYAYNPMGKRDPFRSPVADIQASGQSELGACNDPLCQWDLDQLALVAVVTGDANPIGMMEDPQGRGHIIRRNTRIGKRGGRVTQILRSSVTVTEMFTDATGKASPSPVSLELKADRQHSPELDLLTGQTYP